MLTTFLLFTVSDGKNQLLLALLKCTGKVFWLLAIQDCTYTSLAELYVTPCAYLWVLFAEHLALVLAFYASFSYALHLGQPFHVSDLYSSVSVASIPCRLLCCPASHWCCTSTVFLSFFFLLYNPHSQMAFTVSFCGENMQQKWDMLHNFLWELGHWHLSKQSRQVRDLGVCILKS